MYFLLMDNMPHLLIAANLTRSTTEKIEARGKPVYELEPDLLKKYLYEDLKEKLKEIMRHPPTNLLVISRCVEKNIKPIPGNITYGKSQPQLRETQVPGLRNPFEKL
jgi:hypothetical protein